MDAKSRLVCELERLVRAIERADRLDLTEREKREAATYREQCAEAVIEAYLATTGEPIPQVVTLTLNINS
jgi:hypothetical protein